jgi:ATP/maltotriose-dependent transcriptional regulator MalT
LGPGRARIGGRFAANHRVRELLGWSEYIAAPIVLGGSVIGFLHGDRSPSARTVDGADSEALASFGVCVALVYERAVLRHRLREQREELRQIATWAEVLTGELGDSSIALCEVADDRAQPAARPAESGRSAMRELVTRRELEVLQLMVRGETNAGIAGDLVVSEGTVKFHVKNILRKMHATNRADATSRYVRMTLNRGAPT